MLTRGIAALALALIVGGCGAMAGKPAVRPTARYATAAAVVRGWVYVAGGLERTPSGDATVGALEAYDPDARKWVRCAPMPTPRSFATAAATGGKDYVFGGLDAAGKALATVEAFDPATDSWTACPPMGAARSRAAAVAHARGILVGGGIDDADGNSEQVRIFLPSEGIWREWSRMPSPRHGFGLVDADDGTERVFAVGGYDANGPLTRVDVFGVGLVKARDEKGNLRWPGATSTDVSTGKVTSLEKDYQGYHWRPCPPLAEARGFFGLAAIGRRMYAVGGRCRAIPPTEVLDLDAPEAGWKRAAPMPKDLCRFSLVAWNGHLLAFGGETEFGGAVNADVLEYDPAADTWSVR